MELTGPHPERDAETEPLAGKEPWRVRAIRSEHDFRELETAWRGLFESAADQPVFLSWQWMRSWWDRYGTSWKPLVLVVANQDGDTVGIAPFARRRRLVGPFPVRTVALLASEGAYASHQEVIAPRENRDAVARAVVDHLRRLSREWDVLDVRGLAPGSRLLAHLARIPGHRWEVAERTAPFVPLPDDWEELRKGLRKKVRRNLTYFANLLEKEHPEGSSFGEAAEEVEIATFLDRMSALHVKRRKDSTLGDPVFVDFHREFAPRALTAGWLRMYTMSVGETPVAFIYCLRRDRVVYAYLSAFDGAWARYSVGRQIAGHAIRRAIEEGASEFDWMQGDDKYKYEWTSEERADRRLIVARNFRGTAWLGAARARNRILESARSHLTPEARRRLRERLATLRRALRRRSGPPAAAESETESEASD